MATVDIVIVSHRGIHPEAYGPLMDLIRTTNCMCRSAQGVPLHQPWQCPKGLHSVRLMPPVSNSAVVHWARNQAVAQAMHGQPKDGRPPADYFFLMDDDMVGTPTCLKRLLSYKLDIVTGIATIRRDPPKPNIRFWNVAENRYVDPIEWDFDSQKLMEIDAVGAAFMLVKRTVFERMEKAYLDCEFEIIEDARRGADTREYWKKHAVARRQRYDEAIKANDWGKTDCWFFQFLAQAIEGQVGELGEDIAFCWKAKKLGFKIFADPQVCPGHLGVYGYSVMDYRAWVEGAKSGGEITEMRENVIGLQADPELVAV